MLVSFHALDRGKMLRIYHRVLMEMKALNLRGTAVQYGRLSPVGFQYFTENLCVSF
jgi:hypothetical protein